MGYRNDSQYCSKGETLTLSEEAEKELKELIARYLEKRATPNTLHSSYGLKHLFENILGYYVSNADAKKAMTECGFEHSPYGGQNWYFNVTQKSLNKLYKIRDNTNLSRTERERKVNSFFYRRLHELLEDYWLNEPNETLVEIRLHFVKGEEEQEKQLIWLKDTDIKNSISMNELLNVKSMNDV